MDGTRNMTTAKGEAGPYSLYNVAPLMVHQTTERIINPPWDRFEDADTMPRVAVAVGSGAVPDTSARIYASPGSRKNRG